jgi:LPXTG-motif cell wall-anchored protein
VEAEGDEQRAILSAIVANPANYYVNVHTSDYPQGALRGQLATAEVPDVELPDTGATDNPMLLVAGAAVLALLAGFGVRRRALA